MKKGKMRDPGSGMNLPEKGKNIKGQYLWVNANVKVSESSSTSSLSCNIFFVNFHERIITFWGGLPCYHEVHQFSGIFSGTLQ